MYNVVKWTNYSNSDSILVIVWLYAACVFLGTTNWVEFKNSKPIGVEDKDSDEVDKPGSQWYTLYSVFPFWN